jgi:hypothetical protein
MSGPALLRQAPARRPHDRRRDAGGRPRQRPQLISEQTEYGGNDRGNDCQDGKGDGGNGIQHDSDQVRD